MTDVEQERAELRAPPLVAARVVGYEESIQTFYEKKWLEEGIKIKYLRFSLKL